MKESTKIVKNQVRANTSDPMAIFTKETLRIIIFLDLAPTLERMVKNILDIGSFLITIIIIIKNQKA